ncbi:hypothetical protein HY489_04330 [Candidatus Woesearchaeota archaeon]|nr:hypothetical protein [Candidatus Woesearchaeota archaeon]
MGEFVSHNCGLAVTHTLHDAHSFVKSLQHRGRDAAGIAAIGNDRIDVIKWEGPVDRLDLVDLHKIFDTPDYHTFFAHVRYATRGRKNRLLDDAHPHTIGGTVVRYGTHVLVRDCDMAAVHNGQVDESYFRGVERSKLESTCDTEALLYLFRDLGESGLLKTVPGAYTLAIADKKRKDVIVMRDRTGIRPGVLGWKDGKFCVASEDCALQENGGQFTEVLSPGAVYYLEPNGGVRKEQIVQSKQSACFFEWNYIASKTSVLGRVGVRTLRELLGEQLAKEFNPSDADLVTFLPRCPEDAARSYAQAAGKPFEPVFYKLQSERAFQGPTNEERRKSIELNLYLLPEARELVRGKKVIVIDDSIVRGNNSKRARQLLCDQGAREIVLASYTPPIGIVGGDGVERGCLYGVDMPPNDAFIARGRTLPQISDEAGMRVVYLSKRGMLDVFRNLGLPPDNLCTFCIGGKKPF